MINISKKVLCLVLFSLLIFVSGNLGHGDFWGVKKAFGYGGGASLPPTYTSTSTPTPAPTPLITIEPVSFVAVLEEPQTSSVSQVGPSQVLGIATFRFSRNLNIRSEGDDVLELQKRLAKELVYTGPLTGYFGPLTLTAVKKFQTKNNLEAVGNTGPKTRALLNAEFAGSIAPSIEPAKKTVFNFVRTLVFGSKGKDVRELQSRLRDKGVYNGPVTGYFGNLTQRGVKKLQAKYNLAQVGIVGPLTRELLNKNE